MRLTKRTALWRAYTRARLSGEDKCILLHSSHAVATQGPPRAGLWGDGRRPCDVQRPQPCLQIQNLVHVQTIAAKFTRAEPLKTLPEQPRVNVAAFRDFVGCTWSEGTGQLRPATLYLVHEYRPEQRLVCPRSHALGQNVSHSATQHDLVPRVELIRVRMRIVDLLWWDGHHKLVQSTVGERRSEL